jgi:hypothetical protein
VAQKPFEWQGFDPRKIEILKIKKLSKRHLRHLLLSYVVETLLYVTRDETAFKRVKKFA